MTNKEPQPIEARYQRAQSILQGLGTNQLVQNDTLFPHWIDGTDCFWYERTLKHGNELPNQDDGESSIKLDKQYRLVNAKASSNEVAFDHEALATALAKVAEQSVDKNDLPIKQVAITLAPVTISFAAFERHWLFTADNNQCQPVTAPPVTVQLIEAFSPNNKQVAFVRDYNLWVRDLTTGEEKALTVDGMEDYSYGNCNTAWGAAVGPEPTALWSPDSSRLVAVRRDKRKVLSHTVVDHVPLDGSIRPKSHEVTVALPGDEACETFQWVAFDLATGQACDASYPPMPSGLNNNSGVFLSRLVWWSSDNRTAYFIAQEQGDRTLRVIAFDTHTGHTNILFEETSETQLNLYAGDFLCVPSHRALPNSNELIWWSERTGWGHLYLYDLNTGELKNPITGHEPSVDDNQWAVRDVLHIDEPRREVWIQTTGRVTGRDPYYRDICRVHIDTGEMTTVYSVDEDITVQYPVSAIVKRYDWGQRAATLPGGAALSGDYVVLTRSRVDQAPVSELIDRDGNVLLVLETTDITSLPQGWHWPEPIEVQAADGSTPLYGVLFRPPNFSPDKRYPVINYVGSGPWMSMVPKGSFNSARADYTDWHYFNASAFAALGFMVLQLDSRGTPLRGKAFLDESYGWVSDAINSQDHASAITQLAARYPEIDLDRVGSYCAGYPGGLINFFEQQDLYKVHVQAMLLDVRLLGRTMKGDVWESCEGPAKDRCYPEQLVGNLRQKLLLMHPIGGSLVNFYPVAAPLRVVNALQQANKDFDFFMGMATNVSYGPYVTRRVYDYLVEHLMGEEPPKDFKLAASIIG